VLSDDWITTSHMSDWLNDKMSVPVRAWCGGVAFFNELRTCYVFIIICIMQ
jgi:hypothetical protein